MQSSAFIQKLDCFPPPHLSPALMSCLPPKKKRHRTKDWGNCFLKVSTGDMQQIMITKIFSLSNKSHPSMCWSFLLISLWQDPFNYSSNTLLDSQLKSNGTEKTQHKKLTYTKLRSSRVVLTLQTDYVSFKAACCHNSSLILTFILLMVPFSLPC